MAGHSQWANIRFRKGAEDARRGKIFTKLIRELTIAAPSGELDGVPQEHTNAELPEAVLDASA